MLFLRRFARPSILCISTAMALISCRAIEEPRAAEKPSFEKPSLPSVGAPQIRPPKVVAESVLVIDLDSNLKLYAKNSESKRAVASTQKIVTALCVLDAGNLDKLITITSYDTRCEPTKLYLKPGERYTRRELLKVLMVKSANDVARALARDVGGSVEGFANLMNRKCAELGMRDSRFLNPHGLTEPGQYSTARDIAIAARVAYKSPLLRSFFDTESYSFRYNDGRTRRIENTNRLLKRLSYVNGMKTGTTNASGRCLVSTGTLNGRSVLCVVLKSNSANIWSDSEKLMRWAMESPRLGDNNGFPMTMR